MKLVILNMAKEKKTKRPKDKNQLAKSIVDIATGDKSEVKNDDPKKK